MTFYWYNELATMTIKATGPVTSSVANTAKRVIVMVYMAAVTGKALTEEQKIGAAVAITPLTMPHTLTMLQPPLPCYTPLVVLHPLPGAAVAIGGVLVYSVIDDLLKMVTGGGDKKKKKA